MRKHLLLLLIAFCCGRLHAQSYISVQTLTFDVMGPKNINFYTLQSGVKYKLQMSGTWGDFGGVVSYDTRYYMGNGQDFGYNYFIAAPNWLKNLNITPAGYNIATHTYTLYFTGDGSAVTFTYTDSGYSDNTGLVRFELFQECPSVTLPLAKDTAVCGTPALTLTASGGTAFTWYNAATGGSVISSNASLDLPNILGTDTFYVAMTFSNGCQSNRDTVVVKVNQVPVVDLTLSATQLCKDDAGFTLSGTPAGGVFSGNGVAGSSFDPAAAGAGVATITYAYTSPENCANKKTAQVTVDICAGINAFFASETPGVFPNPASNVIELSTPPSFNLQELSVYALDGRRTALKAEHRHVDVSSLPAGLYVLVARGEGSILMTRFIKE